MMTVHVATVGGRKRRSFNDLKTGNAWARQILEALGRGSEFTSTKLAGGSQSIASALTWRELMDKGVSFFGAVDL